MLYSYQFKIVVILNSIDYNNSDKDFIKNYDDCHFHSKSILKL